VNLVNARMVAEERGIKVSESKTPKSEPYASLLKVTVVTESGESSVAGTVFGGRRGSSRIDAFSIVAELSGGILMLRNQDVPGVIAGSAPSSGRKRSTSPAWRWKDRSRRNAVSLINVDNAVPRRRFLRSFESFRISWTPKPDLLRKKATAGEKRHRARRPMGR